MASIKTGITRTLRSKASVPNPLVRNEIQRGITATSKAANTTTSTTNPTTPLPFQHTQFHHPLIITPPQPRTALPSPDNTPFTTLVNNIMQSLKSTPSPHLPALFSLLRAYNSNSDDWSHYAHANASKQYTRNLVYSVPGLFNLLLLVWTPGKASPVHDHADAHCIMKILKGRLRETRYATPAPLRDGERPLQMTSKMDYREGKVAYMADELGLHKIENVDLVEYAVSLHLYTPDWAATRGCSVFEEVNGRRRHVRQGVYDSFGGIVAS